MEVKYDHIEQAKYELMLEHSVVILTTKRYDRYVRWAKKKYGKDFNVKYRLQMK